jgi:16S rRNA (cytidine1402-2'-O)-methyltransferase
MPGTLYLCATPIGNLGDITQRVLDTLREVDLIAAEDTRNTLRLLNHFEIKKPMTSYHEHNKYDKARELISRLHGGENIAVVTDAGTPAISDPGTHLVHLAAEAGIEVVAVPGPTAMASAMSVSGIDVPEFTFLGFLPREKKDLRE